MKKSAWKDIIIKAVEDETVRGDSTQIDLIVKLLEDYDNAKQILRDKCSWDFESMKTSLEEINL